MNAREQALIQGIFVGSETPEYIHLKQDGDVIAIHKNDVAEFIQSLQEYMALS